MLSDIKIPPEFYIPLQKPFILLQREKGRKAGTAAPGARGTRPSTFLAASTDIWQLAAVIRAASWRTADRQP